MTTRELQEITEMRRLVRSGKVRRIREDAHLSQPEVAAAVGVTVAAISRWEKGDRTPKGAPALAYARLLERLLKKGYGDDAA